MGVEVGGGVAGVKGVDPLFGGSVDSIYGRSGDLKSQIGPIL